jgi:hypothetical protein
MAKILFAAESGILFSSPRRLDRFRGPSNLLTRSQDSSVGIKERLRAGRPEFDSRERQEIFLSSTASSPALRPTQPPVQWVPVALSPGGKQRGSEAEGKNGGLIRPLPQFHHGIVLN